MLRCDMNTGIVDATVINVDTAAGGNARVVCSRIHSIVCPSVKHTHYAKRLVLFIVSYHCMGWLGSRVVSLLDSGAEGPGFKSQP